MARTPAPYRKTSSRVTSVFHRVSLCGYAHPRQYYRQITSPCPRFFALALKKGPGQMHHLLALDYIQLWQTKDRFPKLGAQRSAFLRSFLNTLGTPMASHRRFRLVRAFMEEGYLYIWQEKPVLKDSLFVNSCGFCGSTNPGFVRLIHQSSMPHDLHSIVVSFAPRLQAFASFLLLQPLRASPRCRLVELVRTASYVILIP